MHQRIDVYAVDQNLRLLLRRLPAAGLDYEQGTLIVDIVDVKTSKVVWRGWAQDTMNGIIDNQDRLEKQVDEERDEDDDAAAQGRRHASLDAAAAVTRPTRTSNPTAAVAAMANAPQKVTRTAA